MLVDGGRQQSAAARVDVRPREGDGGRPYIRGCCCVGCCIGCCCYRALRATRLGGSRARADTHRHRHPRPRTDASNRAQGPPPDRRP
jgi:hypothetical protein